MAWFQYFIVIIVCWLIYYYYIDIEFVSRQYMAKIVNNDEYFNRMSPIDLKVRIVESIPDYKKKYIESYMPFTVDEKAEIKYLCRTIITDQPITWKFTKLALGTENNWPHTLGDVICLTPDFFSRPDKRIVLKHEAVHVWQRSHPAEMQKWIKTNGWLPVKRPSEMCNNPDIDEYAYETRRGTLSILSYKPMATSMADTMIKTYYGSPGSKSDHPYEEYAKLKSEL